MSAFIVNRAHVKYVVRAGLEIPGPGSHLHWVWNVDREAGTYEHADLRAGDYDGIERVGQMLWDENIKSVEYRYPDTSTNPADARDVPPGPIGDNFVFSRPDAADMVYGPRITPIQVLKACDCYEYQSCEHPGWAESEAAAYIEALRKYAIHRVPGYEEAQWEITEKRRPVSV